MVAATKISVAYRLLPAEAAWRPAYAWTPRFRFQRARAVARITSPKHRAFISTQVAVQVIAQIMVPEDMTAGVLYPYDAAAGRTGKVFNFRT